MNLLPIHPTALQLEQATLFAAIYAEKGYGKNVLQVSHEQYLHFIRIGKLCEIVLVDYLRAYGIAISAPDLLRPHKGNHKIGADFVIEKSNQAVDVKAANKPFHKRILIREDQVQAKVHDLYIGAKYSCDSEIEFHGYLTGEQLLKHLPNDFGHGLCRSMILSELKPMEDFIEKCLLGVTII